jgi:hypothetical protein
MRGVMLLKHQPLLFLARSKAEDVPTLMLLRQNGEEAKGWWGLPFWWPVIVTPSSAATAIFTSDQASRPPRKPRARAPRDRWQQRKRTKGVLITLGKEMRPVIPVGGRFPGEVLKSSTGL